MDELTRVPRGRPRKDRRALFREAMSELSREMRAKRISHEQIDAAIENVRARRRHAKAEE
jgi:predicted RNA polymerase sigma factor